jgi:hypothetical protein
MHQQTKFNILPLVNSFPNQRIGVGMITFFLDLGRCAFCPSLQWLEVEMNKEEFSWLSCVLLIIYRKNKT